MTYAQLIKAYQETGNQHFLDRAKKRLLAAQTAPNSNTPAVQTSVKDRGKIVQQQVAPFKTRSSIIR